MNIECSKSLAQEATKLFWRYAQKGWNICQLCFFMKNATVRVCGYRWWVRRSILVSTEGHEAGVVICHSIEPKANARQRTIKYRILQKVAQVMKKEGYSEDMLRHSEDMVQKVARLLKRKGDSGDIVQNAYDALKVINRMDDMTEYKKPLSSKKDVRQEYSRLSMLDLLGVIKRSAKTSGDR